MIKILSFVKASNYDSLNLLSFVVFVIYIAIVSGVPFRLSQFYFYRYFLIMRFLEKLYANSVYVSFAKHRRVPSTDKGGL